MQSIAELHNLSKDLTVLYVEDDEPLREETVKLFKRLFEHVETAVNGLEAWNAYSVQSYDIVITDINMPELNGVELVQRIKAKNPTQSIVVTSAHDESQYFIPLIDAGVTRYIIKPINIDTLITTLTAVCQGIDHDKLIDAYRHELEITNEALIKSNAELKKIVRILDTKIKKPALTAPKAEAGLLLETKIQTFEDYLLDHDMSELKELEEDIDHFAVTLQLKSSPNGTLVCSLGQAFEHYGAILTTYPVFSSLGLAIKDMGQAIQAYHQNFCDNSTTVSALLESFFYVLSKWRSAIFEIGTTDPHMYDASLISDMKTIIFILENKEDAIESDIEFF